MVCVIGDDFETYSWILSYVLMMIGVIILELELFWWLLVMCSYLMADFGDYICELRFEGVGVCTLGFGSWMAHGHMSKCV